MCLEIIYLIQIYKNDLALNELQLWICHKTKANLNHSDIKINENNKKKWQEDLRIFQSVFRGKPLIKVGVKNSHVWNLT